MKLVLVLLVAAVLLPLAVGLLMTREGRDVAHAKPTLPAARIANR